MQTDSAREKGIYKVTVIGSIVNLFLLIFKLISGIAGKSSALVADAIHSLSDFFTDIIVIAFVRVSSKPQDKNHDYGHGKYETFATLIIGFVLLLVAAGIGYGGIEKIIAVAGGTTLEAPGWIAFWAAIISILLKEALYWYTVFEAKKLRSDAVLANAWHHRSDAFSSIGTALGVGGAILLGQKWTVLDPCAAVLVSILIAVTAWKLMKPAIDELLERSLPDEIEKEIEGTVYSYPGVSDLHNLRTRKIGNNFAIEFHLRMDPQTTLHTAHEVISRIEIQLREKYGQGTHIIIHIEPEK